ncbi:CRTAC1 family protein [Oceanibium sediminis]|uniref:CRTAC1 family protein n=1 Tax=Oceanibium sediminis TaxID=2026339 RepID=UPI000DD2C8FE|nr:CRTAC1 family protein [Oceanibium sediminis]
MKRLIALLCCLAAPAAGQVRFDDVSDRLQPRHEYSGGWEHFVGGGVAVFDCNADGAPEILAAGGEGPSRLFVNDGTAYFAPGADLAGSARSTGAYPLDIDGDGILDLALLRVGPNRFLRGLGDCTFEDATDRWGLPEGDAWSTAFSATWEPGNTRPTLAIGNYVDRADPEGPFEACDANQLLRPRPGGGYAETVLEPGFCALSILFHDWAGQGRADLRVSNDRHYYVRGGSEQMWRMDPLRLLGDDDGWEQISIWGMGIAAQDLTGDGLAEVVLTSMGDQLMLIAEPGGRYRAAPYSTGTYAQRPHVGDDGRPSTGWHAEFGDVNNDGRADLFIAKGNVDQMPSNAMRDPNNLLIQQADGTFQEVSVPAGVASDARSRGAALADFDGDGRLDLVVVNRRAPLELYLNRSESTGRWARIDLRGAKGNTRGVGALVEVRTETGLQQREVTVGGGHAGGQALALHFGLGDATEAEARVRWPGGGWSDWQPVAVGGLTTLAQ